MEKNRGRWLRAQVFANQKPCLCPAWPLFELKGHGGIRAQGVKS